MAPCSSAGLYIDVTELVASNVTFSVSCPSCASCTPPTIFTSLTPIPLHQIASLLLSCLGLGLFPQEQIEACALKLLTVLVASPSSSDAGYLLILAVAPPSLQERRPYLWHVLTPHASLAPPAPSLMFRRYRTRSVLKSGLHPPLQANTTPLLSPVVPNRVNCTA